ncbi:MAG: DUF504 domain-containing protein [Thermoanaerobaculaceae bacterium]|jgi:uncharacterized protein (UPF0248 family)|nr:DUF504 domain-containing protein [Thermoanaerobaculaceae bacterium]
MTVRELLNRLRWDSHAESGGVALLLRVRVEGRETIQELPFDAIGEILPAGVLSQDGTFLPYHRVVAVRRGAAWLWRAPERSDDGQA